MVIHKFSFEDFRSNCYLVSNHKQAILIDATVDCDELLAKLDECELLALFLTHGHYDHWTNLKMICEKFPNTKIYMSKNAYEKLQHKELSLSIVDKKQEINELLNVEFLENRNQESRIADLEIKWLNLSGHTNCSYGFVIENNFFCGDAIFSREVGRYDLPTSNKQELICTLSNIIEMDSKLVCYAGHGEDFVLGSIQRKLKYFIRLIKL